MTFVGKLSKSLFYVTFSSPKDTEQKKSQKRAEGLTNL
jgi:hypothetical protein